MINKHFRFAAILFLLCSLVLQATPAKQSESSKKTYKTEAISQKVYTGLRAIQDLVEQQQYTEALSRVRSMRTSRLSEYELSQSWNLEAYIHYLRGSHGLSIDSYNKVLEYRNLAPGIVQSTLKTIGQLYFTVADYPNALRSIEQLISVVEQPDADLYIFKGQIYFQMQDYRKALAPIKRGIELTESRNQQAKENWLLLLQAIHHENQHYQPMALVLKKLIALYPKQRYIKTLAGVYSQLGDTEKQLSLMQALYEKQYIEDEPGIINLVNLYLLHNLPVKAAYLLDSEINNGRVTTNSRNLRLLAQSWQLAREDSKALEPLARAADLADDGNLYVQLAQSLLRLERWHDSEQALRKAIDAGKLNRSGQVYLMLGISLFNQAKLEAAQHAFRKARSYPEFKGNADQWLAYVANEI